MDRNVGLNIAPISGGPVKNCYPCPAVQNYPYHYVGTTRQTVIDLSLAWRCPGGTSPPENCPNKDFIQSEDGSECVCKPGFYPVNATYCAKCLKGHQCSKGKLEQCPKHYYQPKEGMVECLKCVDSATDNGFYGNCLQQGYLLKVCDPSVPGTQDQELYTQCVPCNQCRRAFLVSNMEPDPNLVFCYRDR